MSTEIIQVRDIPTEDVETIKARAATRNMSLSRYLRELIHEDASRPTMDDVIARNLPAREYRRHERGHPLLHRKRAEMTTVVDASVVVRLLQNRSGDGELRERFRTQRRVPAPELIDAEVTSAVRGLLLTSKPVVRIDRIRAQRMLDDFADLPLVRYPMRPDQRRVLSLRNNSTAYDACYVALAESLRMPLLTDDRKYEGAAGHLAVIDGSLTMAHNGQNAGPRCRTR